jgi:hypothetical protein
MTTTASGRAIMEGATAIMAGDGIITDAMTGPAIAVMFDGIITDAMTGMAIAVMFAMTTAGITTSLRFDRTSKIFAMRAMKSNKASGICAVITRS